MALLDIIENAVGTEYLDNTGSLDMHPVEESLNVVADQPNSNMIVNI